MKILILGASARAAAFSVLRARATPLAADLFADRDLAAIASCEQVAPDAYPEALFETPLVNEADGWLYTGALENRPRLIDRLASRLPLKGISGQELREVRDPFALSDVLRLEGFHAPATRLDADGLSTNGRWLRKPFHSGGGRNILPSTESIAHSPVDGFYFQERIEGKSLAATYIGDAHGATLVGITEQSVGHPGFPFGYRGSLGPWPLQPGEEKRVAELGDLIGRRFRLSGLFGVDFLLRDGEPWTIEVNPRYTASVEVLELALGRCVMTDHLAAFDGEPRPASLSTSSSRFVAKEVLFADSPRIFGADSWEPSRKPDLFQVPLMADIPAKGTRFSVGDPIVTIFGEGSSIEECRKDLERRRSLVQSRLGIPELSI